MAKRSTKRQEQIYEFIKEYLNSNGYPPSVREICVGVGLSSTSSVHCYLKKLENCGLIKRDGTKTRAIEITEEENKKELIDIPIIGTITAGTPILAVENIEDTFQIPIDYINSNKDVFMLRVSGESMINAGILDGDLAIIEQTNTAFNGDTVVALLDNKATLKKFYKEKDYIRLQPENNKMEPILVKNCSILGKLIGIFRKY